VKSSRDGASIAVVSGGGSTTIRQPDLVPALLRGQVLGLVTGPQCRDAAAAGDGLRANAEAAAHALRGHHDVGRGDGGAQARNDGQHQAEGSNHAGFLVASSPLL
jgi:hypothetical protein